MDQNSNPLQDWETSQQVMYKTDKYSHVAYEAFMDFMFSYCNFLT